MSEVVGGVLAAGRARAQSLMESTVRIRRKTGETRNTATGQITPTWSTIYEGPARIRFTGTQPRDIDAAGQQLVEQTPIVGLPIGDDPRIVTGTSGAVNVDDVGSVLTNPDDSSIVGGEFRVAGRHDQTHSTARRLPVEVFTHGG